MAFVEYINNSDVVIEENQSDDSPKGKRSSREVNLRLRFRVMQRDSFKCCLCGTSPAIDPSVILHVDNILPYSKGGETTMDNLQTLCSKCNLGKGDLKSVEG